MKNQKHALMFGVATVLLWSTVATAFKLALAEMTPPQLLLIACGTSVLVLAVTVTVLQKWSALAALSPGQYFASMALGSLNPALYYLVLFEAYDRLPAQEAQSLNYTWALALTYLAVPFLGQKLSRADIVAGLICYSGVVIIATRGKVFSLEFADPVGVGLALASTVIWASYWIINTRDEREPLIGLLLNFTFGLPVILGYCLLTDALPPASLLSQGLGLYSALYVGVFEMGIAFVLWMFAMKRAENTSQVSNLIFISPFLSLILIYFVLDEAILGSTYVGLVLIIAGLLWQQRGNRPLAAAPVDAA